MQRTAFYHEVSPNELDYLRSQGLNNQEIAQRAGCSAATVSKYLPSQRKARVKLNGKDYQDILELYLEGNTVNEIAKAYDCSLGVVYRVLKTNGVDLKQKNARPEVIEKPEREIPEQNLKQSSRMVVHQIGLYEGREGMYKVDLTEHKVEFPEL